MLGVDKAEYIKKAALKQPQLFCQSPETINNNIELASNLLGIDKTKYIVAALKSPSLFCQAPKTIHRNARALTTAWEKGYIKEDNLKDAFLKNPGTLTSAPNNTLLRSLHANFT